MYESLNEADIRGVLNQLSDMDKEALGRLVTYLCTHKIKLGSNHSVPLRDLVRDPQCYEGVKDPETIQLIQDLECPKRLSALMSSPLSSPIEPGKPLREGSAGPVNHLDLACVILFGLFTFIL